MPVFRRTMLVTGALALALNSGCYAYQPVATGAAPAGQSVRARLNAEGTAELTRFLGPRVRVVEGTLASVRDDGALVIGVEQVQTQDGLRQPWAGEGVVTFPRQFIEQVEVRALNRRQTTIASVALLGALVLIAVVALAAGFGKGSPDSGGGPPPAR